MADVEQNKVTEDGHEEVPGRKMQVQVRRVGQPAKPTPQGPKLGLIARMKYSRELGDHVLAQIRSDNIAIEGMKAEENISLELVFTGELRLRVADRAGEWAKTFGPDSPAYELVEDVATRTLQKLDVALNELEDVGIENQKRNRRRP